MQFAFLAFLIGQSLEGFAQWKGIVQLLLSCEQAPLQSHPSLYTSFLNVLQVCPGFLPCPHLPSDSILPSDNQDFPMQGILSDASHPADLQFRCTYLLKISGK